MSIFFVFISAVFVRGVLWFIPRIVISASDIELGGAKREKAKQAGEGSEYAISQRLLYRPFVPEWER